MNIAVTRQNFNALDVGIKVLFALMIEAEDDGTFNINKSTVAEQLKVSRQTVGKHICTFASCNMLKFKYSGQGIFNPDFHYTGAAVELNQVREKYKSFKSDV